MYCRTMRRVVVRITRGPLYHPFRRNFSLTLPGRASWGFIGLGQMGYNMAKNLRSKIPPSDTLFICDTNANATAKFVQELSATDKFDIRVAKSARELAEKSETIISSLPGPESVKLVFDSILQVPLPSGRERLFIDCSTIDLATSHNVARAVISSGSGQFVDAPMSGGVVGAQTASLTFMFGASVSAQLVDRVTSVLLLMGKKAWHLGVQGAGLSGKLANNYLLAITNIATAEAMNMGIKSGLDPNGLSEMINSSSGRCWSSAVNNPVPGVIDTAPAGRNYEGGFGIHLMKKDLKLATEMAQEFQAPLLLAEKALDIYNQAEKLHPGKDFSVVYQYIANQ
ncbi:6-phosphogluconate dehydrogenase [Lipomyces chichibuensis]|uniref:6-phosphogluconate dehydrogenase n=1 Tax=Lipomyces chichibuensis TaxID=1546026 RepID=UPI0033434755